MKKTWSTSLPFIIYVVICLLHSFFNQVKRNVKKHTWKRLDQWPMGLVEKAGNGDSKYTWYLFSNTVFQLHQSGFLHLLVCNLHGPWLKPVKKRLTKNNPSLPLPRSNWFLELRKCRWMNLPWRVTTIKVLAAKERFYWMMLLHYRTVASDVWKEKLKNSRNAITYQLL